jgi:hypothetical protein
MPKYKKEKGKKGKKKEGQKAVGDAASALLEKLSDARMEDAYGISITMMYEPAGGAPAADAAMDDMAMADMDMDAADMAMEAETGMPPAAAIDQAMEGEALAEADELDELSNMPVGTPGRA